MDQATELRKLVSLECEQSRRRRPLRPTENLESGSIPQAILILADYQYKAAFAADAEINLTACMAQLMMECKFK